MKEIKQTIYETVDGKEFKEKQKAEEYEKRLLIEQGIKEFITESFDSSQQDIVVDFLFNFSKEIFDLLYKIEKDNSLEKLIQHISWTKAGLIDEIENVMLQEKVKERKLIERQLLSNILQYINTELKVVFK